MFSSGLRSPKLCFSLSSRKAGTGKGPFAILFFGLHWIAHPYALLCSVVLCSRTAPEAVADGLMVAVLPVVPVCMACPAMQRAALIRTARNTQRTSRVHCSRHVLPAGTGGCRPFRLPLLPPITARPPPAVACSLFVPTHFIACSFTWVFSAICECCFVLAVCRSFG